MNNDNLKQLLQAWISGLFNTRHYDQILSMRSTGPTSAPLQTTSIRTWGLAMLLWQGSSLETCPCSKILKVNRSKCRQKVDQDWIHLPFRKSDLISYTLSLLYCSLYALQSSYCPLKFEVKLVILFHHPTINKLSIGPSGAIRIFLLHLSSENKYLRTSQTCSL